MLGLKVSIFIKEYIPGPQNKFFSIREKHSYEIYIYNIRKYIYNELYTYTLYVFIMRTCKTKFSKHNYQHLTSS